MRAENGVVTHPGTILQQEFLDELGQTQSALARHIGVSVQRINELVNGKRGITPDTAWLLSQALNTTPEFWMSLQMAYDLNMRRPNRPVRQLRSRRKQHDGDSAI